jgi:hypothetical protein
MAKTKRAETWPIVVGVVHLAHGNDSIFSGWTEKAVYAKVYAYVKEWWDDYCADQDLPKNHKQAIDAYFDGADGCEYLEMMGDSLPVR